ncbi:MAG: riboflavin synthase [Lachnospiraceae bacterium]|nr:riboflavin synthase [Lachnospiraceae bacterium]
MIEEVGTIKQIKKGPHSAVLHLQAETILNDLKIGDSVAVNGVCLTATQVHSHGFCADVMHETLNRSSLAALQIGSQVNLERAMAADGRFGGHIVAGHVDGLGRISQVAKDDNAIWYTIKAAPDILRYIVEKGSVAIDGISLTVARVSEDSFAISAIPHTVRVTTLCQKGPGDPVNLETDIIGKYVEKLMAPVQPQPNGSKITRDFLEKYGF